MPLYSIKRSNLLFEFEFITHLLHYVIIFLIIMMNLLVVLLPDKSTVFDKYLQDTDPFMNLSGVTASVYLSPFKQPLSNFQKPSRVCLQQIGRKDGHRHKRWCVLLLCLHVRVQMQKGQLPEGPPTDLPHLHLCQRGSVCDPALSPLSCQSHTSSLAQRNHPGG